MRPRPWMWITVSMLCFVASFFVWRLADERAARNISRPSLPATNQTQRLAPANPGARSEATPIRLLSQPGHLNYLAPRGNTPSNQPPQLAYRLSNTRLTAGQLARSEHAILLQNALVDTTQPASLPIPDFLRAQGDPGSYVVQARGPVDNAFRAQLKSAGATVIAYIPNNAYLVRASASAAQALAGQPLTQTVLPYEPYYKLNPSLLRLAVEQRPMPESTALNLLLFADARDEVVGALQRAGIDILAESPSPFGPVVKVQPPADSLPMLAGFAGVQEIEVARERVLANDLSRAAVGVAADSITPTNYLNLTGGGIMVAMSDTGVDATHPDLQNRVLIDTPGNDTDTNGHGTHVAGIIAGDGTKSTTVTNALGSIMPGTNGQFRGKAPAAKLFSMSFATPNLDFDLQQRAARTNAAVVNNSWTYIVHDYDLAAASYDAAVRDALPTVTGSQPLLYVFPAGNGGGVNVPDDGSNAGGTGGNPDSIESPGTAKNVITVGAVEQNRNITNQVVMNISGTSVTNQPWVPSSDSSNQVANFSSRGNVGIRVEGDFGRFKPDVVAPGTFVVSTRSAQWDEATYYDPTTLDSQIYPSLFVDANSTYSSGVFVPAGAISFRVTAFNARPPANLTVTVTSPGGGSTTAPNQVTINSPDPVDTFWDFSISNSTPQAVTFDLLVSVVSTNSAGDFFQVLSNMNDSLGGFYRYESGTSMAAADVAGTLALMQDFFRNRLHLTNSPALMKALLINGARSLGDLYDFQVANGINYQGWGQIQLPNSIPGVLSNVVTAPNLPSSMFFFEQDPTNALATGQSQTRFFKVNNPAAQEVPLRVTVVWTDPPGDPAASIKLVNDLDLVVTNLDTGEVFFGNDMTGGHDFNAPWDTNTVPNVDVVNNVENVYVKTIPAATNGFSVTVIGHRVNVNAVTANPDDTVQDYAMVVSSGNGEFPDALALTSNPGKTATITTPNVFFITNSLPTDPENPISGGLLQHQRVGANTPLLGTNTVPLTNSANAVMTVGMTNQWRFYVLSNEFNFTNASFVTFLPPELAVPRMGVTNNINPTDANRVEADIDLYVSTEPGLTNLDPNVIDRADKSVGRGGTEFIVKSNAAPGGLYYVGVKAEDQQAAEFDLLAVFSLLPPTSTDTNGNRYLRGIPVPSAIPPGTPPNPQAALVMGLDTLPVHIRRVVVTNTFFDNFPNTLLGNLSHNQKFAVLNNHTCIQGAQGCITNLADYVYEDNGEMDILGSRPSDGPGSLKQFIGEEGLGVWLMTMVSDFPANTGAVRRVMIKLEPQNVDTNGTFVDLQPLAWHYDSIDVPLDATNLTICISGNTAPVELYVQRDSLPATNSFEYHLTVNPPGDCLPITIYDTPPLVPGSRYFIGVYNPNLTVQHIRILATVFKNPFAVASSISGSGGPVPILDDAVTYSYLTNFTHLPISSLDVGLLISDPRVSDLAITLISPNGTRILLFENRGALSTNGLGSFSYNTNSFGDPSFAVTNMAAFYTNNFDKVPTGWYTPGAVFDGWSVLSNYARVFPELPAPWLSNNVLILLDAAVSNSLPTTNSTSYSLSFEVTHAPYLVGTIGWWPMDGSAKDIFGGFDGILAGDVTFYASTGEVNQAFFGDGLGTRMVVPAAPQLDVGRLGLTVNSPAPEPVEGRGFTLEGWINPANITNAGPIAEWNNGSGPGVQFWLSGLPGAPGTPGSLLVNLWDTNSQPHLLATAAAITNNGWQHVAFTYNSATLTASLYTNGMLAVAQPVAATNTFQPRTSGDLWFGFHPAAAPNFVAFKGGLDELGLYNRALSDCEVAAIFNAGTGGKYGTNVLSCPLTNQVQLLTSAGPVNYTFVNGLTWTNGPQWETNTIYFTNALQTAFTNGPGTNLTPIILRGLDPNTTADNFVLSALLTNYLNGLLHFTENTNVALVPIKFAPAPYAISNFPPTLIFTNDFESVTQRFNYAVGDTLPGTINDPAVGRRDWTVVGNSITVLSNSFVDAVGTNCVALAAGGLECELPTTPGQRYRLTYSVRGPGAVSWWSGDVEPLSHRAWDLLGGNNGAFLHEATNSPRGFVQAPGSTNALFFPGLVDATNNLVSKIELGDPSNLRFTNSFTIEGWIRPSTRTNFVPETVEQVLFRGDSRDCLDPYWFGVERVTADTLDLVLHVERGTNHDCGVILETSTQPVIANQWQHIAAVFESNVQGTNTTGPTNQLRLYYNGRRLTPQKGEVFLEDPMAGMIFSDFTREAPFRDLDPAYSPGVSIGARSRADNSEEFYGALDELSVYGRALTDQEIAAIAGAGSAGKADFRVPPAQSLAKVSVLLDNVQMDVGYGDNSHWGTRSFEFTATRTNTVLALRSLLPGTLVDGVALTQLPAELNYLPEEDLRALNGEDAAGRWTLEIWDKRTGVNATNSALPVLLDWQLNFVLAPSNPPPVIELVHGIPYTNTLTAFGLQNFVVNVPQWATNATNVLLFATDRTLTNLLPVNVLWDLTNQSPNLDTNAIFWQVSAGVTNLATNVTGTPYIIPGQPYYLTVTNPNPFAVRFAYGVWFDLISLTNCQPLSNFVWQAGVPRYFQFDVPTNGTPPDVHPQVVSVYLTGVESNYTGIRSNITMVLSQHLPLPDLDHFDYTTSQPSTNDDAILVITNSTPFPIQEGRWYVGIFNQASTNVPFTIQACYLEATNAPEIIPLTNGVPYLASFTNHFAPPGAPRWFFFEFQVTNSVDGVLFEMYNLSGDADLVLQRDVPPGTPPYFAGSFSTGLEPEQIVLRPTVEYPDLRGNWFLGVYNNEATNVTYTLRAVVESGGLLQSAQPLQTTLSALGPPNTGLLLQWNSVIGEYYVIEYTDSIVPMNWQPLFNGLWKATTPLTTFPVSTSATGVRFFRVRQVSPLNAPTPPLIIQVWTNNLIRLSWSTNFPNETLQFSLSPAGPWFNANLPVTVEGNEYVVYDAIGTRPRYYRLIP